MQAQPSIAFLGAGNMARAIISGLITSGYSPSLITAVNRTEEKNTALHHEFGINTSTNAKQTAQSANIIVLGVKPQLMAELLASLTDIDWQHKLIISIAAGVTVQRIENLLNTSLTLVRAMPNTPALIGQGMTGLFANSQVTEQERAFSERLMRAVGKVVWVQEEAQINAVIAAAGSAPAYFFLFMEAMQEEAIRQGFSADIARELVQQSALGAAQLVCEYPNIELDTLRAQVTSKGGTTEQAIQIFQQHQMSTIVAQAMQAAVTRAQEMETLF